MRESQLKEMQDPCHLGLRKSLRKSSHEGYTDQDSMGKMRSIPVLLAYGLAVWAGYLSLVEGLRLLNPWPIDYDSFYYFIELRSYLETGHSYYGNLPFIVGVMAAIVKVFSCSMQAAYGVLFLGSFFVFVGSVSVLAWNSSRLWISPLILFVGSSSQTLFLMHYGYLKQAVAMALVALSLCAYRVFIGFRHVFLKTVLGVCVLALLVISAFIHKFAGVVGILILASLPPKSFQPYIYAAIFVLMGVILMTWGNSFSNFSIPDHFWWPSAWIRYRERGYMSPFEFYEIYVISFASLFLLWKFRTEKPKKLFFWALLSLLLLIPIWDGFIWRAARSAFWLIALTIALWKWLEGVSEPRRAISQKFILSLSFIYMGLILFLPKEPHFLGPAMPLESIERNAKALKAWIPEDAFILAEHGHQYRLTYFLNRRAGRVLSTGPWREDQVFLLECRNPKDACVVAETFREDSVESLKCLSLDETWQITRAKIPFDRPPNLCP